ncbi:MAG: hypothetical protein OK439_02505 [Thaumarchaeota archaeon]|nr:hypothetical protein [Nitrososphaerota archaeon]
MDSASGNFNQYFRVDENKGIISGIGGRVVVLNSSAWGSLQAGMYRVFSSGASVILYDMGRTYGRSVAHNLGESRDFNEMWPRLAAIAGWGKFKTKGDLKERRLEITVQNCAFCEDDKDQSHGCSFLKGVIDGTTSELYEVVHSNMQCSGTDNHLCEFEIYAE